MGSNLLCLLEKVMDREIDGLGYFLVFNFGQVGWPAVSQRFLRFWQAEARGTLNNHDFLDLPGIRHGPRGHKIEECRKTQGKRMLFPGGRTLRSGTLLTFQVTTPAELRKCTNVNCFRVLPRLRASKIVLFKAVSMVSSHMMAMHLNCHSQNSRKQWENCI